MRAIVDDQIAGSFSILRFIAREVAMEQMSKAGNAVREGMRNAMKSEGTNYITRVGENGPYPEKVDNGRQYGLRESHTQDGVDSNPPSMANMIISFLMEKSGTLVVGGMNPRFRPLLRKDGEVVGTGSAQPAVGARTAAILHRMDTGERLSDYPVRSMLYGKAEPRDFMSEGISRSEGKVRGYLTRGFDEVTKNAVNNKDIAVIKRVIGE